MSIFIEALQTLIDERLTHLGYKQESKSHAIGHDHDLSLAQLTLISNLKKAIIKYTPANPPDDIKDKAAILQLIADCRKEVVKTRGKTSKPVEEGTTIGTLDKLVVHTTSFFDKLQSMEFNLLDIAYTSTPENIVYYHAAYYIGQDIFKHESGDTTLRASKELAVQKRLKQLSLSVIAAPNFKDRKEAALQAIEDIQDANVKLVGKTAPSLLKKLPKLSLFYVGFDAKEATSSGKGRLEDDFNLAQQYVTAMTVQQFDPKKLYSANNSTISSSSSASVTATATMFSRDRNASTASSAVSSSSPASATTLAEHDDDSDDDASNSL